jgi:hypothetical protein
MLNPSKTYLVPDSFPVESCRLASMLLSFHFLKLWHELELKGVSGVTGKNDAITHYWLELDDIVIDITGSIQRHQHQQTKRSYRKKRAFCACSYRSHK